MARIRTIKPDFFRSDSVSELSIRARLTWIGLWTYCDDYGRGDARPRMVAAGIYPVDPIVSVADVEDDLAELAAAGRISLYSVAGKPYVQITNWDEHQKIDRRSTDHFPAPESADPAHIPADPRESSSSTGGDVGAGTRNLELGTRNLEVLKTSEPDGADTDPTPQIRDDVQRLCDHLADRIEGNDAKRPTVGKAWRDAARRMLDNDGRDETAVHRAIDWCQDSEFWRANILSMPALRKQYDRLRLQARARAPTSMSPTEKANGWLNVGLDRQAIGER